MSTMISTLDIARHDQCERFETWSSQFDLPRIPLNDALNQSLRAGLLAGDPLKAYSAFMARASTPGLDIEGRSVYDIAVHHANLIEVVCAYLLGADGPWIPHGAVSCGFDYQPLSYLMADGRLRRVVLCSTWSDLREAEERNSWWTVADTAATGRPMLLNAIVIGQSRGGFRASSWTTGFIHPENGIMRVKKREGRFTDNWKRVYRENADCRVSAWLSLMQQDGAFEDIVEHCTIDVPEQRKEILADMARIAKEIGEKRTTMRRSACYRYGVCPMMRLCSGTMSPELAGWQRKGSYPMIGCV